MRIFRTCDAGAGRTDKPEIRKTDYLWSSPSFHIFFL